MFVAPVGSRGPSRCRVAAAAFVAVAVAAFVAVAAAVADTAFVVDAAFVAVAAFVVVVVAVAAAFVVVAACAVVAVVVLGASGFAYCYQHYQPLMGEAFPFRDEVAELLVQGCHRGLSIMIAAMPFLVHFQLPLLVTN